MKILAIAYACEPNRGSEPGVGWNWTRSISQCKDIELSVVTRKNNKEVIELYNSVFFDAKNIEYLYYDLPASILKYKKGDKNIKLFFSLWQLGVIMYIKNNINLEEFDCIWDFNFGSLSLPNFAYMLHKRIIIGPASTKESVPKTYLDRYNLIDKLKYCIQQFIRVHLWLNPFTWRTLKKSSLILTCNEMSRKYLPREINSLAVFHNGLNVTTTEIGFSTSEVVRFVYAGRLIASKNLELAINAFAIVATRMRDFRFEIYGSGRLKKKLVSLVSKLQLDDVVFVKDKVSQKDLFEIYRNQDFFVFPSLLEISSTAVMEAMYSGLVPICLDIKCMEYVLDNDWVIKVPNLSPDIDELNFSEALIKAMREKGDLLNRKQKCHEYAKQHFTWREKKSDVEKVAQCIKNIGGQNS